MMELKNFNEALIAHLQGEKVLCRMKAHPNCRWDAFEKSFEGVWVSMARTFTADAYEFRLASRTITEQQIAAAWNAQADKFNQWDELDLEEKIEWAAKWGASQARKPLSDGRLVEVIESFTGFISGDVDKFVAHIESAHGITQEKQGDQENG